LSSCGWRIVSGRERSAVDFAGTSLRRTLWAHYSHWQAVDGLRPSVQLGLGYPWVAQDLDLAAAALGNHVKSEFEKRRREAEQKLNPKPASTDGKRKRSSPYKPLEESRVGEIWYETVSLITEDKIVIYMDGSDKRAPGVKAPRWRIEKPRTGDEEIDGHATKGARTTFDEHGRRRAAWDASGRLVFSWKPGKG